MIANVEIERTKKENRVLNFIEISSRIGFG